MTAPTLLTVLLLTATTAREHLDAANAALAASDAASAIQSVDRAIEADPDDLDAREIAARLAIASGRFDDAVEHLEHLLKLDPQADDARLLLARAQWLAGRDTEAEATLDLLLTRHPELEAGLALRAEIGSGPPAEPSFWQPSARLGIAVGYDSNLSLDSGTLPDVSNRTAGLMDVDLAASVTHANQTLPVTVFGRVTSQVALAKQQELHNLTPSTVDLGLVGRRPIGSLTAAVDLRYQELFTNGFSEHRQRLLGPSVWATYRVAAIDTVQLTLGAEVRQPSESFAPSDNLTVKAVARNTLTVGKLELLVDLALRRNTGFGDEAGAVVWTGENVRTEFDELGGSVRATYAISDGLGAFLLAHVAGRSFESGVGETTLHGSGGVRYAFGALELHAEYAYSRNASDDELFSYARHRLSAGIRAYYE